MAYARKNRRYKKKRYVKKAKKATIKAVVKSVLDKQEETKMAYYDNQIVTPNFLNNEVLTIAPTQTLQIGTAASQRVGNSIYLKKLILRNRIWGSSGVKNLNLRFMVLWSEEFRPLLFTGTWLNLAGGGINADNIFFSPPINAPIAQNGQFNINRMVDYRKGNKILYDKVIHCGSGNATNTFEKHHDIVINFHKKLTYLQGTQMFNGKQLYVIVVPSAPATATGVDTTCAMTTSFLLTYKDS